MKPRDVPQLQQEPVPEAHAAHGVRHEPLDLAPLHVHREAPLVFERAAQPLRSARIKRELEQPDQLHPDLPRIVLSPDPLPPLLHQALPQGRIVHHPAHRLRRSRKGVPPSYPLHARTRWGRLARVVLTIWTSSAISKSYIPARMKSAPFSNA